MLTREDGSLCEDLEGMKGMAERFYADLFASECCDSMEEVLESIPRKVDDFINEELCKPYSNSEIKMALFQMGPTKAPGPDGFPALFYQTHWEFIEEEICSAVRSFLARDLIPEGLCDSVIVLIPKVNNATHLSKFRPISLCNVLYKIASKVLSNRLKPFLPGVVSEFQSAFVPGRLITDSALVSYECLHSIKKQQCKKPFFALKVDMMKAYDRVEWSFLHGCLLKLGFADPWIQTVMRCVTSVRYAVRINGELTYPVTPSRGLRQGDPISPYLFLLCTEGLSSILQKKESMGVIQGIRNGHLGPPISHLLFADDSIFFARSDLHSVQGLKDALQAYCKASGQKINLQKSSIFFGQNCPEEIKNSVKETLQVSVEILQDTYLGMPTEIGRASIGSFLFLPERVWRRVNGWNDRPMSRAGKETMLKAVAQAIPTYVMSCFKLPVTTCEKMKSCILDHWVLKGRYFPNSDFWNAPKPTAASFTWRSILFGRDLLRKGVRWGIGNGSSVKILKDHWIPGIKPSMVRPLLPMPDDVTVDFLVNAAIGEWDEDKVFSFFDETTAQQILQIPVSAHGGEDFISWPHDKRGVFSVRSAYNLARSEIFMAAQSENGRGMLSGLQESANRWKELWRINAPGKMLTNLWRIVHDCLPSGFQLRRRHIPATDGCCFCERDDRIEHIFLLCPFAVCIWDSIKQHFDLKLCMTDLSNMKQWVFDFLGRSSNIQKTALAVTLWHIWEARNHSRNNPTLANPRQVIQKILAYVEMIEQHCCCAVQAVRGDALRPVPRWRPPPEGTILINTDAAVFQSVNSFGLGFLFRDHSGLCLFAANERHSGCIQPEMAEALAIRCALRTAMEEGHQKIVLASDCLAIIQKIQSGARDRSMVGALVSDINFLAAGFLDCSFIHVNRVTNAAAHLLAQCSEQTVCNTYRSVIPETLREVLLSDLN
ncbi:hypothetical protein OsJ_22054 [Oryza sativa Japonica Group]|uniref:Reverse transcriptase domain-containing protein n=1 Tax=Oryza sativa subsp. japonica TaxID=39947 RepID=B9FQ15_ORYSJ|nr:hypothetical protein OsJ_22054 [Oryza sativa Japonica Group]